MHINFNKLAINCTHSQTFFDGFFGFLVLLMFYSFDFKRKIEDFLHHDYVRMVYTKIRLKSIFDIHSKSAKSVQKGRIHQKRQKDYFWMTKRLLLGCKVYKR